MRTRVPYPIPSMLSSGSLTKSNLSVILLRVHPQRNPNWLQINAAFFDNLAAVACEKEPPGESVIWLDEARTVLDNCVERAVANWFIRHNFQGRRNDSRLTSYEQNHLERFNQPMTRGEIEELHVAEFHVREVGSFHLRNSGQLTFSMSAKYPTNITLYGYYCGASKEMRFRVKPSHQEKWERATEQWSSTHVRLFQTGLYHCGNVYKAYRQVLDKCAERQFAKTLP